MFKRVAGSWVQLGASYSSGPLPAGTKLRVTAVGSTVAFLQDGVQRIAVSDASFAAGAPGIVAFGTGKADNWAGGAAAPVAGYSVGGTVSGLSGTVFLQNNGGDDLSVGANGAFRFGSAVPDRGAYNVTVRTNPSGQVCTVGNGSGTEGSVTGGSDDFNRANGGLGSAWTNVSDGGLVISGQLVSGVGNVVTGAVRTAEAYPADQFSEVQVGSTQLTGGQWIGPAVRMQNGGQSLYSGIYFWNNGNPELRLFKRVAGGWVQLGASFSSGPWTADRRPLARGALHVSSRPQGARAHRG